MAGIRTVAIACGSVRRRYDLGDRPRHRNQSNNEGKFVLGLNSRRASVRCVCWAYRGSEL
jgi:hypothetical protein